MNVQHPETIIKETIALAEAWQDRANALLTSEEKGIVEQMMRLLTHPMDKVILTKMIDQSFRSHNPARVADIKAGGPNYVFQFMNFEDVGFPSAGVIQKDHRLLRLVQEWKVKLDWGQLGEFKTDLTRTIRAVKSYLYHWEQEFSREKDYFRLRGQDNTFRYLPVGTVAIRIHPDDSLFDVLARIAAVKISGCELWISLPPGLNNSVTAFLYGKHGKRFVGDAPMTDQPDKDLMAMIPEIQRIRYAAPDRVPDEVFQIAAETGFYISRTKVSMEGRIELLQYFQEQSICSNYHRYGNLGERAL